MTHKFSQHSENNLTGVNGDLVTLARTALDQSNQTTQLALGDQIQVAGVKDAVQTGVFATVQAMQAVTRPAY